MAELDVKALTAQIKGDEISGFYFLYGDDDYSKKRCFTAMQKKLTDTHNAQVREFERHNFDVGIFEDESEVIPFGADSRLFILRNIEADKLDADSFDRLCKALEQLAPWCTVIWVVYSVKADFKGGARWKKLKKSTEKTASFTEFKKADRATMEKRLCDAAKRFGCEMSRDVAAYLMLLAGEDSQILMSETEKMCAYANGGSITKETVDLLVCKSTEASIYDLSKAVLACNSTKALSLIDSYYYMKTEPVIILSGLSSAFVDLYRAKAVALSGEGVSELVGRFDYPKNLEFRAKNALRDCGRLSLGCLRNCIDRLAKADLQLKSSRADSRLILEKLVCELILLLDEEKRGVRL